MFTIWIIAAVIVFAVSLVIAVISVEKDKKLESFEDDVAERGDAMFLEKEQEAPKLGHGEVRQEIEAGENRGLLDDTRHSHMVIAEPDASQVNNTAEAVRDQSGPSIANNAGSLVEHDEEDQIIPRYLEEEMNDKEQSKKLAGEIDL